MKSFYKFYQQVLREAAAPVGQNSGQPQAGGGGGQQAAPPAPGTAPPPGQPAVPPGQGAGGQPQGGGGQGVAPPVPAPDPAVQQIQQLLNPMAAQLQGHIEKIQDPKVKEALKAVLGQGGSNNPQQAAGNAQPKPPAQPPQPPAQAGAAKPAGQQ